VRLYIGADPGETGAVVGLREDGSPVFFFSYPLDERDRIKRREFKALIKTGLAIDENIRHAICCLEKSQAMPGQGGVSMFNYGVNYGILLSILELSKIDVVEITPQKWKKEFDLIRKGVPKKELKENSVLKAIELFPNHIEHFRRPNKRDKDKWILLDGRAEATLIAEYCRRNYGKSKET
jgi:hypothetical protein